MAGEGMAEVALVTRDPAMLRVLDLVGSVAANEVAVLVHGESGTGKHLLARRLHHQSPRRNGPFAAVHCAALSRERLASALFGHEPGAVPGALVRALGVLELTRGGTVLLEEIGELESGLQARVLRLLREQVVERVGSREPVPVDVRIVATTTRRLRPLVDAGRLRGDLFDCLSGTAVVVPSLRERRGDIELLAAHVLERLETGRTLRLDGSAQELLAARPWPGNVRELVHVLERAAILAQGAVITAADLEDGDASPLRLGLGSLAGLTVREVERRLIVDTLERTRNNRTQAAKLLGISIRTLRNKLAEYRARGECVLAREPTI